MFIYVFCFCSHKNEWPFGDDLRGTFSMSEIPNTGYSKVWGQEQRLPLSPGGRRGQMWQCCYSKTRGCRVALLSYLRISCRNLTALPTKNTADIKSPYSRRACKISVNITTLDHEIFVFFIIFSDKWKLSLQQIFCNNNIYIKFSKTEDLLAHFSKERNTKAYTYTPTNSQMWTKQKLLLFIFILLPFT